MGEFGAGLLGGILPLAGLLLAAWCTDRISKKLVVRDSPLGCVTMAAIFIAIFSALYLVFNPAVHLLRSYECRKADHYHDCMNPLPVTDWM